MYPLGRVVEHDPRSRQPQFLAAQRPLKTTSHLLRGPVLDQGNLQSQTAVAAYLALIGQPDVKELGSCTGNGISQALNTFTLRGNPQRRVLTEVDAIKLYARATEVDAFDGTFPPTDSGSSGIAVCKAAKEAGYISAYHHAFGIDQALAALVVSPVIIGIPWRDSMWETDAKGYLDVSGQNVGGHEVALVALNTTLQRVLLVNNWSAKWGLRGYAYLRWPDLDVLLRDSGDVTVPVL